MFNKVKQFLAETPAVISSTAFVGISYQNWVYIATALYYMVRVVFYVEKRLKRSKVESDTLQGA